MSRFLPGKKWLIFFLLMLIIVLLYISGGKSEELNPVERATRDTLAPVYNVASFTGKKIQNIFSYPEVLMNAAEENKELRERVRNLEAELREMEEIKQENERLKQLLYWKENEGRSYNTEAAAVIGHEPGNWLNTIVVNKGSSDGIEENMTVVSPAGLVGRIINVSGETSEVLLVTDPRSGVGAFLQETRAPGIIEGVASGSSYLRMNHIPANLSVSEGETVVTSGQGSIYVKGISIGAVVNVEKEDSGLFKVATIKPFVDFNRLEEVLIIK